MLLGLPAAWPGRSPRRPGASRTTPGPAGCDRSAEVVSGLVDRHGAEIAGVIGSTVESWDARETADLLESYVGRDLQFIRINGTVVGGLVGLLLHAAGQFL